MQDLQAHNFALAGIEVSFETYSNGEGCYTMVDKISITALDLTLDFHRQQGYIDSNRFNCAAVSDIALPSKLLNVYHDGSTRLYVYVGKDWQHDKDKFVHGFHVNSKLYHEPRIYLRYIDSAACKSGPSYLNRINPYLAHDNDLGREYDPVGNEPTHYDTYSLMKEFDIFLGERVLPYIAKSTPTERVEPTIESLGPAWKGYATPQNRESLYTKLRTMLMGRTYTFDSGWSSSREREQTFVGISTRNSSFGGSISVSDSYGIWGFDTDGKTFVGFIDNEVTIDHTSPSGNPLHWKITVIDEQWDRREGGTPGSSLLVP